MTVSAKWYGQGFLAAFNKEIDWAADAIKVSLHTSSYAVNQDTDNYYDDVTDEVGASGSYVAGGMLLPTPTIGYTAGTNVVKLSGSPCAWTTATITARYAVIYDSTPGTAATNPLIGYVDFGGNVVSVAGTFTITWDGAGILTITPA